MRPQTPNYSRMVERFRFYDENSDGYLNEGQFNHLMKDLQVDFSPLFVNVCLKGISDDKYLHVHYHSFKTLYDAILEGPQSKAYQLVLFRGLDSNHDGVLTDSELNQLIYIVNTDIMSEEAIEIMNKVTNNNTQPASYSSVMKHVFSVNVPKDENPFSVRIVVRSHHSSCCFLF